MKASVTAILLLTAAASATSASATSPPVPGELLHKDATGPGITTLLERERALRTRVDAGARAGWLNAVETAELREDIEVLERDVRAVAMGNVAYTPQRKFDALFGRLEAMESYVSSKAPKARTRPRRR